MFFLFNEATVLILSAAGVFELKFYLLNLFMNFMNVGFGGGACFLMFVGFGQDFKGVQTLCFKRLELDFKPFYLWRVLKP